MGVPFLFQAFLIVFAFLGCLVSSFFGVAFYLLQDLAILSLFSLGVGLANPSPLVF